GFTLIEVLAVILLLALSASAAVFGIASTSDRARLDEARSVASTMDARARVSARSGGGPVRIEREAESEIVRVVRLSTGEILDVVDLGPRAEMRLRIDGRVVPAIDVDACGQTKDYEILLSSREEVRVL